MAMATRHEAHHEAAAGMSGNTAAGRDGGSLTRWVRRHPVGAYLAWYFPVVWAISFIPTIVARDMLQLDVPAWVLQLFINAATLLGIFLPAVVITRVVDGPAGMRVLLGRAFKVRASVGWYAVALLAHSVSTVLVAVLLYGRPEATAATLLAALASGFLLQTAVGLVANNLWEEVGVMGFLQARLQARHGALLGAVITAPFFALQHVALFVGNGIGLGLVILVVAIALLMPFRALMGWMYNRTGSLFLVGLLHAAGNAAAAGSGFGDSFLRQLYPTESLVGSLHSLVAVLLGLAVIAATRGRLGLPAQSARGASSEGARVAQPSDAGAARAG
jgi:membrane protease YdiL (CAAX protease family)